MLRIISSNLLRAGGTGKRVILLVQHKGSCGETLEIIAVDHPTVLQLTSLYLECSVVQYKTLTLKG